MSLLVPAPRGRSDAFMRWGAWAGMGAAAVFVGTFTIEGLIRPGYSPVSDYVSALSLGPRGWVQITNFVITGALLLVFAARVAVETREGRASRAAPVTLGVVGLGILLSGPFVMDPVGTPRAATTLHGAAHQGLGAIVFATMPVTCFIYVRRTRVVAAWHRMRRWTMAVGTLIVGAIVLLKVAQLGLPPHEPNALTPWVGLVQRAALVPFFAWLFAVAWTVLSNAKSLARP